MIESVVTCLADARAAVSVEDAARLAPAAPGLYAIHVRDASCLPEPWRSKLIARQTRLLYVGQASQSLLTRLVEEELRHRRAATFFRGLGAVLGYRPARGSLIGKANQNNYRFSASDTAVIMKWMEDHLAACWVELPTGQLDAMEIAVVCRLRPLFNTKHNSEYCGDLARVREECRAVARMA